MSWKKRFELSRRRAGMIKLVKKKIKKIRMGEQARNSRKISLGIVQNLEAMKQWIRRHNPRREGNAIGEVRELWKFSDYRLQKYKPCSRREEELDED
jgi:hypothetical protein